MHTESLSLGNVKKVYLGRIAFILWLYEQYVYACFRIHKGKGFVGMPVSLFVFLV